MKNSILVPIACFLLVIIIVWYFLANMSKDLDNIRKELIEVYEKPTINKKKLIQKYYEEDTTTYMPKVRFIRTMSDSMLIVILKDNDQLQSYIEFNIYLNE